MQNGQVKLRIKRSNIRENYYQCRKIGLIIKKVTNVKQQQMLVYLFQENMYK